MAAATGYQGATGGSRREARAYACPCGERFAVELVRAVDARRDPELARELGAGRLNRARCPSCGGEHAVQVSVLYHDPIAERMVLVLPDGLRHRELEERARLYLKLAADGVPAPEYVRRFEVVFGADELGKLVRPPAGGDATAVVPLRVVAETMRGAAKADPGKTPAAPAREPEPEPEPPVEPLAEEPTGRTRMRTAVPDLQSAAVERWVASREGPSAFLADDKVVVCAALRGADLEALASVPLELRVQLHRMPTYPLAVVTLLAAQPAGEDVAVFAPLDVARAAHRAVLEALARKSEVTLLVYDGDYLPVVARSVAAPLEENAARLLKEAKEAFTRLAPATRNFDRARGAFLAPGYERLGRVHVALSDVELGRLSSPCALRQAVATVARWSEPGAEAYLAEVRSFPLGQWRRIRTDVVRAAIEHGLHSPKALTQKVLAEANVQADWSAVLKRQLAVFTEVALRMRANDLSPDEEAENWRLLVAECEAAGVTLDPQVEQLARAAERRARAVAAGAVDLRALSTKELAEALDKKEHRREAAMLLVERHDPASLPALFQALRKMTRAEASRLLPATVGFGEPAERYLVEGLRSRKSFLRQGSALALAAIGGELAVESLARLLLEEPTEIWPEVARALGDLGAAAVMPLALRLRNATPEGRERIARALAHVLVRGVRGPVELLAAGRDPTSSQAAKRALELEEEVRAGDAEVRGGAAPRETTVVRSFTRRFYDGLGGGPVELSAEDLEEIDDEAEMLEEADLVPAREAPPPTDRHPRLPRERNP